MRRCDREGVAVARLRFFNRMPTPDGFRIFAPRDLMGDPRWSRYLSRKCGDVLAVRDSGIRSRLTLGNDHDAVRAHLAEPARLP